MAPWFSIPALLLLVSPFVTLIGITQWHDFHFSYGDGDAVRVSIVYGLIAIAIIIVIGLPVALWLSRATGYLQRIIEVIVMIPLLTPPLAMGILLVSVYGPYGSLGTSLSELGISLVNNPYAFILAQVYGALPYFIITARSALMTVPRSVTESGQVLGANAWQILVRLIIPAAAPGLAAAVALAWVRAIGEFGIAMIFAYFPQGIPVKLYTNLQNDGVDAVYALVWLLLVVTIPLPLYLFYRSRQKSIIA